MHGYSRLSSQCSLFKSTPVQKFVLLSTKLALQNKHFGAQKLPKTHLHASSISKIYPAVTPPDLLYRGRGSKARKGKGGEGEGGDGKEREGR